MLSHCAFSNHEYSAHCTPPEERVINYLKTADSPFVALWKRLKTTEGTGAIAPRTFPQSRSSQAQGSQRTAKLSPSLIQHPLRALPRLIGRRRWYRNFCPLLSSPQQAAVVSPHGFLTVSTWMTSHYCSIHKPHDMCVYSSCSQLMALQHLYGRISSGYWREKCRGMWVLQV